MRPACPSDAVVVLGQAARDLVLTVDGLPPAGGSTRVQRRTEVLGGKGANQAVALTQLGRSTALVGVVGDDDAGRAGLQQARRDGIDVSSVVCRGRTALLVDVVEQDGRRRLLEDVPGEALLREEDVLAAGARIAQAGTVSLQLQQPARALVRAVTLAAPDALVVLDGAPDDAEAGGVLLQRADVLRMDAEEAELVVGAPVTSMVQVRELLERGPRLVAVGLPAGGDLVAWQEGQVELPPSSGPVVDPTGGGDSFVAGLIDALQNGARPEQAAWAAARAAASTVARAGGRPDLTAGGVPLDRRTMS
jgi:ribokinase